MKASLLALPVRGTKIPRLHRLCPDALTIFASGSLQPKNLSSRNTVLGLNFRVNVVFGVKPKDGSQHNRLDCDCRIPAAEFVDQLVLPAALLGKHRGVFRVRAKCVVVAGGHVDGGDYICRGHAVACDRSGGEKRNFRKLDLVVAMFVRDDDGFLFRAVLAARRNSYRRGVCGVALRGKARGVFARFSRDLSGRVDELPDPRLGHQGDDQHHHGAAG